MKFNYDQKLETLCNNFGVKHHLSPREVQCLNLTVHGRLAKEIAYVLGLRPKTVETYLDDLREKLDCRNKMELLIRVFMDSQLSH